MFSKLLSIAPIAVVIIGQGLAALAQNPLVLVRYNNGGTNAEVHITSGTSNYQIDTVDTITPVSQADALTCTWTVENGDVYCIKIVPPTGTNTIQVHRLSKASTYQVWDLHSGSGFPLSVANEGTWTIDGGDLYFIKTSNTPGMIEVQRGSHTNKFELDYDHASAFPLPDGYNATVTIRNGDLYLIKTSCTDSNQIEVYIATRASDYQAITSYITVFPVSAGPNGFWEITDAGDLYFIKYQNVPVDSGKLEVHFARKASGYQATAGDYATFIPASSVSVGTWIIDPVA